MKLTYEIKPNGYIINRDGRPWISQLEPYAKLFVADGSYEDNAKAQIAELSKPVEPQANMMTEVYSALDDLGQTVEDLTNAVSEIATAETPAKTESEVTNG